MSYKDDFKNIPDAVWDELDYQVARHELEYADNYRAYNRDTKEHKADYQRAQDSGCCGFFETRVTIDGQRYTIGCNYGH